MRLTTEYRRAWFDRHPLYPTWQDMRRHCGVVKGATARQLSTYRGVTICSEWDSYAEFETWALANGWRSGLQVARIDKTGPYSPGNCVVVPWSENVNMRRNTARIGGVPLRKVIGDTGSGRHDRAYARAKDRYFRCGWDERSSVVKCTVPASENPFISARSRSEAKENTPNERTRTMNIAKLAAVAFTSAAVSVCMAGQELDEFVLGSGPAEYVSGGSVTNVRSFAFSENRVVTSIVIDEAENVGNGAFRSCTSLRSVTLGRLSSPARLQGAFSGCPNLISVNLPNMDFTTIQQMCGFPWQATNSGIVFNFRNGSYDRFGRKINFVTISCVAKE